MPEERPPAHADASNGSARAELPTEDFTPSGFAVGHRVAPGAVLARRFRIVRLVAMGGMGEVYEALDTELGTRVALKTLRGELASNSRAIERFRQELVLARKIGHPNVCRVFELHLGDLSGPPLFITMEFLEGETLAERLKRGGPVAEAPALDIVRQVAAALDAAHSEGVVHRDLKARNVMLVPLENGGQRAVVTDFGIARALDAVAGSGGTWEGPVGTPAYMAPEQLSGGPVSPATDLYALGVLMYEITTGQLPFAGDTPEEVATERARAPPPDPGRLEPRLSKGWRDAARWCLSVDPALRPRSPSQVVEALLGERPVGEQPTTKALVAIGLLVLLGVAAWVWRTQASRHPAVLTTRPAVAIVQAANLTGAAGLDWLTAAMPEAVTAALEPIRGVRLVPPSVIAERQLSLGAPTEGQGVAESFGSEPYRRLAESLETTHLLVLSFEREGEDSLRWTARLKTPGPEPPLTEFSVVAASDSVEPVARTLAAGLSRAMHWERAPPDVHSPLIPENPLPRSEAGRRAYIEGLRRLGRGDDRGASSMFAESVDAEPGFLPAHTRLLQSDQEFKALWFELPFDRTDDHEKRALAALASAPESPEKVLLEAWTKSGSWEAHATLLPLVERSGDDLELQLADVSVAPPPVALARLAELRASRRWPREEARLALFEAVFQTSEFQFQPALEALARGMVEAERSGDRLLLARMQALKGQTLYMMLPSIEAEKTSLAAEHLALDRGAAGLVTGIRLGRAQRLMWWGRHGASSALYRSVLVDLRAEGRESLVWRARVLLDLAWNEYEVGNDRGVDEALGELGSLPLRPVQAGRLASFRLRSALNRIPPAGREAVLREALRGCGSSDWCRLEVAGSLVLELLQQDRAADAGNLLQQLGPEARGTGGWAWIYLRVMSALGRCPQAYSEIQPFVHSNLWLSSLIGGARLKAALASCLVEMGELPQAESLASSVAPYFVGTESLVERTNWLTLQSRLALARGVIPADLPDQVATVVQASGINARVCLGAELRMYQGRLLARVREIAPARRALADALHAATRGGCLRTARLAREATMALGPPSPGAR